jgi:hypothetical protein
MVGGTGDGFMASSTKIYPLQPVQPTHSFRFSMASASGVRVTLCLCLLSLGDRAVQLVGFVCLHCLHTPELPGAGMASHQPPQTKDCRSKLAKEK